MCFKRSINSLRETKCVAALSETKTSSYNSTVLHFRPWNFQRLLWLSRPWWYDAVWVFSNMLYLFVAQCTRSNCSVKEEPLSLREWAKEYGKVETIANSRDQKVKRYMFYFQNFRVGVGRAIAESISCLLPEMAVATPNILHSINLWNRLICLRNLPLRMVLCILFLDLCIRCVCYWSADVRLP